MNHYTYNFREEAESFPHDIPAITTYKDVDENVASIVGQVESAVRDGNYAAASELIENYENSLQDQQYSLKYYMISTQVINRMIEDIRNAQIFAISNLQQVYTLESEPLAAVFGDIWVGGE